MSASWPAMHKRIMLLSAFTGEAKTFSPRLSFRLKWMCKPLPESSLRLSHKVGLKTVLFSDIAGQAAQGQHVITDLYDALAVLQV